MKILVSLPLLLLFAGCTVVAQPPAPPPPAPPPDAATASLLFTPDQLDQLLGPIALYPDALIALILPASTAPSDIVLAARYFQAGGDPSKVDSQPWDDSVRALAHYPDLIRWMDQNLAWTKQLGDSFAAQPSEVMSAVQRLRGRARAAGTLANTPQQEVVVDDGMIEIVPTQPDVIYIPYYDPALVYSPPADYYSYSPSTFFGFSAGFAAGWWLSFGCDWHHHRLWTVDRDDRERFWREHREWRDRHDGHNRPPPPPTVSHPWHPRPELDGQRHFPSRPPNRIAQPTPRPGDWHGDQHRYLGPQDNSRDRRHESPSSNPPVSGSQTPRPGPTAARSPQPPPNSTAVPPRGSPSQPASPRPDGHNREVNNGAGHQGSEARFHPAPTPPPPPTHGPSLPPAFERARSIPSNNPPPPPPAPQSLSSRVAPMPAPPHVQPPVRQSAPPPPIRQSAPPPPPPPQGAPQQQPSQGSDDRQKNRN